MSEFVIRRVDVQEIVGGGVSRSSAYRIFKDVPRMGADGSISTERAGLFSLADVVVALRQYKRSLGGGELRSLVALDTRPDDPTEALAPGSEGRAARLISVLTREENERLGRVMKWAAQGVSEVMWGAVHLVDRGRALKLLALRPAVLAYVLTAERRPDLPNSRAEWGQFMAQHVVTNGTPEELKRLVTKEKFDA